MCGIVAYIGNKKAGPLVLDGLKRLEYRGYDSAGLVVQNGALAPFVVRVKGRVSELENEAEKRGLSSGSVAIAHTRWATHGEPSEINAHPQCDCNGRIFAVHNGIIENYLALKKELLSKGHKFVSDTDTEVIAHLIEENFRGTLEDAVASTLRHLRGTWALAVLSLDDPDKIVAARQSSPLLLGVGKDEYVLASDASAVLSSTSKVVYIDEGEMVTILRDGFRVTNVDDAELRRRIVEIPWTLQEAEKSGFDHFMRKEIEETSDVVLNTMRGRVFEKDGLVKLGGLEAVEKRLRHIDRLVLSAMGTSYHAALLGEYFFEELAQMPLETEYAAEFRYKKTPISRDTAFVAISQSGETADTLGALREAKRRGMLTLGIVNVVGSTIARETDAGVYNHAGPEIGVASTKAFISQVVVLLLMAVLFGRSFSLTEGESREVLSALKKIPADIKDILRRENEIKKLAQKLSGFPNALFLGRKWSYPAALEGALKLKEISYLHAEGYNAAEMKHGPIALIDESFMTIALAPQDEVYEKMRSNMEEIKARKGPIIAVATQGDEAIKEVAEDVIFIPKTHNMLSPLLSSVALQLLAYHVGVLRDCDVDKPRNLAKSVTVE